MSPEQPKAAIADPPPTFSLRTMFLFVTCFGIACAACRIAGARGGLWLAAILVVAFLTVWFFVTGRRNAAGKLFIALLAMVILVSPLLLFAIEGPHEPSRRVQCVNNLKQIGLALLQYHQINGSFPPAYVTDAQGKPLYSWRVAILPSLDAQNIYDSLRLDQPWNSAANNKWSLISPPVYQCPQDNQTSAMTDYVVVVGPNTAWPGAKGSKLADFKDPSKTILVVEVANSGINWAEPRDLYIGQMAAGVNPKAGQGISSHHSGCVNVVFADGSIRTLDDDTDPELLARMLEIKPTGDFIIPP